MQLSFKNWTGDGNICESASRTGERLRGPVRIRCSSQLLKDDNRGLA
jgi:hypothetical protein